MLGTRIYLAPIGSGVGDVIVALPAFTWLAAQGASVYLVARGPRQLGFDAAIPNLSGVVREPDLPSILASDPTARYINLRDHDIQRNYDWYGEAFDRDYPGYGITDIMSLVARDHGVFADFNTFPRMNFSPCPDAREAVLLVPGTTSDFKALPTSTWLSLISALRAQSIPLLVLGEPDRSPVVADLISSGVPHLPTPSMQLAIDAISSSRACISVDTGLMHIAVQQGVPTVAIFNNVHAYYRPALNCIPIFGPPCATECKMQNPGKFPYPVDYKEWIWWEGEYNYCRADATQHCMSRITLDSLLSAFAACDALRSADSVPM